MSDFLFWTYYVLGWVAAIGGCLLAAKLINDAVREAIKDWKPPSHKAKPLIIIGTGVEIIVALFMGGVISFAGVNIFGIVAPPDNYMPGRLGGEVYSVFEVAGNGTGRRSPVTHAYWVGETNSLVLNDIAPDTFDEDILNVETSLQYLFQFDRYYAEIQVLGARPFSVEVAREFALLPFERSGWQLTPWERLEDDRRHRQYRDELEKLPSRQRSAIRADIDALLVEYLASTPCPPSAVSARSYLEDNLDDWFIESINVVPKTNNW